MKKLLNTLGSIAICLLIFGAVFICTADEGYADSYNMRVATYNLDTNVAGDTQVGYFSLPYDFNLGGGPLYDVNIKVNSSFIPTAFCGSGYRFVGWKLVHEGQSFEDGEYIHKYLGHGPRIQPSQDNDTLYAVYEQGEYPTDVGIEVKVLDDEGIPTSGVVVKVILPRTKQEFYATSDDVGIARTEKGSYVLEMNPWWPDALTSQSLPSISIHSVPEGFYKCPIESDRLHPFAMYYYPHINDEDYMYGHAVGMAGSSGAPMGPTQHSHIYYELKVDRIPYGGLRITKTDADNESMKLPGASFEITAQIVPENLFDRDEISEIYKMPFERPDPPEREDWMSDDDYERELRYWEEDKAEYDEKNIYTEEGYAKRYQALYGDDALTVNGQEYADGETVMTVTTGDDGTSDTGNVLPTLTNKGQKIVYSIKEVKAPAGYGIDKEIVAENITLTADETLEYTAADTKKEEPTTPTSDEPTTTTKPEDTTHNNDNDVQPDDETTTIANKNAKSDGNSSTGDSVNLYVYILLIASLVVITTIVLCSRRRSGNTNK